MTRLQLLFCVGALASVIGCDGGTTTTADAGRDTGGRDGGADLDTGAPAEDTGLVFDSGATLEDSGADALVTPPDAAPPPDAGMCIDLPPGRTGGVARTCSPGRPPGAMGSAGGACVTDADCTAGINGRCGFGRIGAFCSYDTCFSDADCADGEACLCDGSNFDGGGNSCVPAACRTNNDCAPGFACSPTFGSCGHYTGFVAFECHTAADECTVDADCGAGYCAFDATLAHWVCSTSECVG